MKRGLLAVVLVLGFAACRKQKREHVGEPPSPLPPAADAAPVVVAPGPDAGDCVAECIARNQMKATSPENIAADCRKECGP